MRHELRSSSAHCASCGAELEAGPGVPAQRVLLVGDSHTYGPFGRELERLLTASGSSVVRRARIGSAVKYWLPHLPGLLGEHRPDLVIVALGANMRGYPSARGTTAYFQRAVALIKKARPGARIVWIGPPRKRNDSEQQLQRFNALIKKGLAEDVTFIDSAPHTTRYEGNDGEHYAAKPAQAWARGVFSALSSGAVAREAEEELEALSAFEFDAEEELERDSDAPSTEIEAAARQLGAEWSRRRSGSPSPDAMTKWLLQDYADTLEGARKRWGKKFGTGPYTREALGKAWLTSRQQNMRFQGGIPGVQPLGRFEAPKDSVKLVSSALIEDSDKAPVAPLLVKFVEELRRRYPRQLGVSNYANHGGGSFAGRGYSLDLFLQGQDARGFYPPAESVKLLRAVHDAATAARAQWRVIYNDFTVAEVANRALGRHHVIYVGNPIKQKNGVTGLVWHGPAPLILHLHLDLAPLTGAPSVWNDTLPASSSSAALNSASGSKPAGAGAPSATPTPPASPSAYRKFRLTQYYTVDQADYPTGAVKVPILDVQGKKLGEGSPAFFASLALEGRGKLTDGRTVNVAGKMVGVSADVFAPVYEYHKKHLAKRPPSYSGLVVDRSGRVTAASAFEVSAAGYGTQRGIPYVPYRTLAADLGLKSNSEPAFKGKGGLVPARTRVFLKEFVGVKLPDGSVHDGWFTVNDTGGGIFGAHFDVFAGTKSLARQVKVPKIAHAWFPGIEQRIPADYTYGLSG